MFCSRCGTEVQQGAKFCPSCGLDLAALTTGGGSAATQRQPAEKSEFDIVRDTLKDEYELIKELGRGGMAIVFKARDKSLDREVAIKVLPFSLAFDKDFVERFQREAKTSAKLEHPNIIPIYRVGRTDKVIYFVMKFLRGTSLSDAIEKEGPLPVAKIRQLLSEAARALHYAHTHGIVHRDIKPDNIMFDELGHAIVTDFGIAKAASGTKLTGTGMSIGTPHYMSPEQARAQPLDGRSDVYSLGVVGFQCLTGGVPFDGEDSFSIGYKHIMEELPVPPLRGADQREMYEIIKRMMAKSPDDRFQNAEQLALVLEGKAPMPSAPIAAAAAPTVAMKAAPTMLSPVPPVASSTTPTTPMPRAEPHRAMPRPEPKKRSGVLVGMFFFLLLGGGGAGGYWYFMMGPGKATPPQADPRPPVVAASPPAPTDTARAAADSARPDSTTAAPAPVTAQPLPTTGDLAFGGYPMGARVAVDGKVVDPSKVLSLEPRTYQVEVRAVGYETYSTTVALGRGDNKVVQIPPMKRVAARATASGGETGARPAATNPPAPRPAAAAAVVAPACDTWGTNYNANSVCFDTRPQLEDPAVPVPAGVEGNPTPSVILVYVSAEGRGVRATSVKPSSVIPFHIAALQYAREGATYRPAEKDGKPVAAWAQFQFFPKR